MHHIFFIHSSVNGPLGCFHILAVVSSASRNKNVSCLEHLHVNPVSRSWMKGGREVQSSSVAQSCPNLGLHGLQHARPPCPSPTPGVDSHSCPSSWWCHPTSHPLSPPSPPILSLSQHQGISQFQWVSSSSGGQNIGVSASASILPIMGVYYLCFKKQIWLQISGALDTVSHNLIQTLVTL